MPDRQDKTLQFRRLIRDIAILVAVPVALIVIHSIVPVGVREQFYLQYYDPTLRNAFASGFLNRSWNQLENNVTIYTVIIAGAYAIYWRWQNRREFWIMFLLILVLTPFVTAIFDYSILHMRFGMTGTSVGFSGITSAYAGMLLASIGFYTAHRTVKWTGIGLVFTTFLMASWVFLDNLGGLTLMPLSLLLIGILIGVSLIVSEFDFEDFSQMRDLVKTHTLDFGIISYGVAFFIASISAGFPPGAGEEGVNILAHLVGIVFGFLTVVVWLGREKFRIPWVSNYTRST